MILSFWSYYSGPFRVIFSRVLVVAEDSFTFVFEASEYTQSINFTLQHPQSDWDLNVSLFTRDNWEKVGDHADEYVPAGSPIPAGEYKVNLPPGPLYSRIVVYAASKLQIPPTRPLGFRCLAGPQSVVAT